MPPADSNSRTPGARRPAPRRAPAPARRARYRRRRATEWAAVPPLRGPRLVRAAAPVRGPCVRRPKRLDVDLRAPHSIARSSRCGPISGWRRRRSSGSAASSAASNSATPLERRRRVRPIGERDPRKSEVGATQNVGERRREAGDVFGAPARDLEPRRRPEARSRLVSVASCRAGGARASARGRGVALRVGERRRPFGDQAAIEKAPTRRRWSGQELALGARPGERPAAPPGARRGSRLSLPCPGPASADSRPASVAVRGRPRSAPKKALAAVAHASLQVRGAEALGRRGEIGASRRLVLPEPLGPKSSIATVRRRRPGPGGEIAEVRVGE